MMIGKRVILCLLMGGASLLAAKGGPNLGGPEAPYRIQWPEVPELQTGGVSVVSTTPESLSLLIDSAPPKSDWDRTLMKGQTLEIKESGGQVLLVWRDIDGGYILHQLLEGPGRVRVDESGRPQVEGTGWAHLFRTMTEALGTYHLTYEEVNTGFESTEVAFVQQRGIPKFLLLEGQVVLGEKGNIHLKTGQMSKIKSAPSRARRIPSDLRKSTAKQGTEAELSILPNLGECPSNGGASELLGAPLFSEVCFSDVLEREETFRVARDQVFGQGVSDAGHFLQDIGDVYLNASLFGEAAGAYQKALIAGGVDEGDVALELGNARWAYGDAEGAVASFEIAVNLDKTEAGAWMNLGLVSGVLGNEEQAVQAFGEAVRLDPSLVEAQRRLGELHLAQGNAKAAVGPLRVAVVGGAGEGAYLEDVLGRAYRESGQGRRAVKLARRGVKEDPERVEGWHELARSLMVEGKQLEAMRAYEKALDLEMERIPKP